TELILGSLMVDRAPGGRDRGTGTSPSEMTPPLQTQMRDHPDQLTEANNASVSKDCDPEIF
ncbi:hypothetical protein, partial [Salinicola salarius]|uniref:hypothetical protein n=1 Tax=Salinicola salarius TaxID=430457 RepID=UPI0026F1562A